MRLKRYAYELFGFMKLYRNTGRFIFLLINFCVRELHRAHNIGKRVAPNRMRILSAKWKVRSKNLTKAAIGWN